MAITDALKKLLLGSHEPIPVLGRNDICWCGSGRKYKTCHMSSDDRRRAAARATVGPRRRSAF